jgi:hypothetical protein
VIDGSAGVECLFVPKITTEMAGRTAREWIETTRWILPAAEPPQSVGQPSTVPDIMQ